MYIDTGTFWIIAIALAVAIGAVYWILNNKINYNTQKIASFHKLLKEVAEAVDQEFANVRNESHRSNAEIYNTVADVISELEKKQKQEK